MVLRQHRRWILRHVDPVTRRVRYWAGSHWTGDFENAMRYSSRQRVRVGRRSIPEEQRAGVRQNRIYETRRLYR
jgi:hypothetical protein